MAYRLDTLTITDPGAGKLEVRGDGFAAAGETLSLLESADVQRFLAMSPPEIADAAELVARYRNALKQVYADRAWQPPQLDPATAPARQELATGVRELLGAERARRLERLSWRVRGADALADDALATALALTPKQRAEILASARQNETDQAQVLKAISAVRLRGRRALEDRGTRADHAGRERLLRLLTREQRAAFERLLHEEG